MWSARYALAVTSWDSSDRSVLAELRRSVTQSLRARWMFAEVGLYLIVLGHNSDWRAHMEEMAVDRTGLHATIIQGIHYINTQTGEFTVKQSTWGPVTFGGTEALADLIASVPVST